MNTEEKIKATLSSDESVRDKFVQEVDDTYENLIINQATKRMELLVKKYNDLIQQKKDELASLTKITEDISCLEDSLSLTYANMLLCNHLFVASGTVFSEESHTEKDCHVCVKCGLIDSGRDATFNEKIIYSLTSDKATFVGGKTKYGYLYCDPVLAIGIYNGIKRAYPKISDKLAREYIAAAIYMINKNKVTTAVQASRIRRLGIPENYFSKIKPGSAISISGRK